MANYNPFGRLIKVQSAEGWAAGEGKALNAGNLAFGHWDDVYKIWANGIEYNIADASAYEKLIQDLSTYVHEEVDSSIDRLDSSVSALETWKAALKLAAADNKISIDGVAGSVNVLGEGYLAATTVDGSIKLNVVDGSLAKKAGEYVDGDEKLATKGYVDEEVTKAKGDLTDLSTYVHTTVNASIDNLQADVADISTNRLPKVLVDLSTGVTAADNVATVQFIGTKENGTTTGDSLKLAGDNFVKVAVDGTDKDKVNLTLNVADSKEEIADSSSANDSSVATAYAVKSYVEDKIKNITGAFVYRGTVSSEAGLPADAKAGDVYVANAAFTMADGTKIENGDMLFYNGEKWGVVERNLDGAVTTGEEALSENYVILGNGNQSVKDSTFTIGADTSADFGSATELAVESAVKAFVEDSVDDLAISAAVTEGADYIDASVDKDNNKKINIALDVAATLAGAEAGELADARQVYDAIQAAGGKLTAKAVEANKSAEIDLTAAAEGATEGGLGKVIVKSVDEFLKVNGADSSIALDLSTATLADAKDGKDGLATAVDVYTELSRVEEVTTDGFAAIQEAVGLDTSLKLTGDFKTAFGDDKDLTEAVIDLSTNLKTVTEGLDAKISAAIDSSINDLDSADAEVAGQVIVEVSEEDGIVSRVRRAVEINGNALAVVDDKLAVTLDGEDILVGGTSAHKDSSISKAILDLSTAIDNIKDNTITGEEALEPAAGHTAVDDYVAVTATTDANGNTALDASVLVVDAPARLDGEASATASGLATDAYVANYVANALAWEVI